MKRSSVLACLAFLSIALAYTGATSAADTAPAATPTDAKKVDWENMSFDQRKKLMKSAVLPELKKAFQAFDPKKYEDVHLCNLPWRRRHGRKVQDAERQAAEAATADRSRSVRRAPGRRSQRS